ncbi:MAG TPA: signal peptide peptidase SppA [Myxococcales bacterium]|jgi:protease-4
MRFAAVCLLGVALPSFAQRLSLAPPEPPLDAASLFDDGSSLDGNPGGLGFVRGVELDWIHDGAYGNYPNRSDSVLFAGGVGGVTLGAGVDFLRRQTFLVPSPSDDFRRFSLGLGFQAGQLGVGAIYRNTSSGDPFHREASFDLGAVFRPFRFLALGAAAFDANAPNETQVRRWDLSLALRPLYGVRRLRDLSIAGDLRWSECPSLATVSCGIGDTKEWFVTAALPVARGVRLLGQYGFLANGESSALVGAQFDLAHLGVSYAARFQPGTDEQLWRVRLSSQNWESFAPRRGHAVEIDLRTALERPKLAPLEIILGATVKDPFAQLLAALRRIENDGSVEAVVFRTGGLGIGMGRADELRAEIENLRARGKKTIFYLESGGDLEYSVATSTDRIFAAPQAVLLVNGFSATALFAAAGLDKVGVKAEFFRVGAYKNAPDIFTRTGMSDEQREVTTSLLDDAFARYVGRAANARRLDEGRFKSLLDAGLQSPRDALAAGLLDGLLYPDQLEEEAGKLVGHAVALRKLSIDPKAERDVRWGTARRIAVVRVEGDIVRGDNARDPFGAVQAVGSVPLVRAIRRAADDPSVGAIVVRIDSPGGDGTASDLVWRELIRARKEKHKPVIASMGDVAASGGYYVAVGADEIVAEPSTITGSIGVFIGHFDGSDLMNKLGLSLVTVKRGESADLFEPNRSLTAAERARMQAWVDDFYRTFVERVSEARQLRFDEVDQIARGRVWTGAQALQRKLVDKLGGLEDAIALAKDRAGLPADAEVEDESEATLSLSDFASVSTELPFSRALRAVHLLGEPGTIRAALPFELEIH